MSNINPIFSIEYPNLDTLLFIRKQYPQLADMEIGTSIIDEECIIAHYLPAEDKPCQLAEELIYFGTLLASTKLFHRTDDQYDLVYRCVSLAHEAEESKTVEAFSNLGEEEKIKVKIEVPSFERVNQVSVDHARRNDVLTITYPRDKTVFAGVNFKVPNLTLVPQTEVINAILFMLKDKFGSQPELRLYVGKYNVTVHIFDFTRFCIGSKTTIEDVVPNINAVVLKHEHLGEPWVEVNRTDEVLFVNQDDLKSTTLGDLLRQHFANSQQEEEQQVETPFTGFKPDEVVPLQGAEHSKCPGRLPGTGETVGYVDAAYDTELDQLSITYPHNKTLFSVINLNDPNEYFDNITSISESVRTIFKLEYDFNADIRLLGIKDKIKIYVDDLSKVAKLSGKDIKEVIMHVVPKVNALVLKPQFNANRPG